MKKNLIVGVTGQDGSLLANNLLEKGEKVIGTFRRGSDYGSKDKLWRLKELGINSQIIFEQLEINDPYYIQKIILKHKPDFIYHLAGYSFVGDSFESPISTISTNVNSTLYLLETLRQFNLKIPTFFSSSSEIFDTTDILDKNESSKMSPKNPYGISKLAVFHLTKMYREVYKLPVSTGIFFNHESPYRSRNFVTRKISYNMARLSVFGGEPFALGNIYMERDWSSASDFINGMILINQKNKSDDYVFSSGKLTSVKTLVSLAASEAGFDPVFEGDGLNEKCLDRETGKILMNIDKKYYRENDTIGMKGDPSKLRNTLYWTNQSSIQDEIKKMVIRDLERIKTNDHVRKFKK